MIVDAVIPALNEEASVGAVVRSIRPSVRCVVVVDNGSSDRTAAVATSEGATVVFQPQRGYGSACLAGLAKLAEDPPEVVLFLDADGSDVPAEASSLLALIDSGCDLAIGSRTRGDLQPGSMTWPARIGNWLAPTLIRLVWHVRFTDLGPFRAIRWSSLQRIAMTDQTYGWTVEMQIKAARCGLVCGEVPVTYRKRIGKSKISGTLKGCVGAGTIILVTWFRHAWGHWLGRPMRNPT
ncbi:MAG: glycosyltransferase family 2 protein [Fibrobacteres bacterium]|nr:glycosyltransferase family 2 protein [Fibrobacterota bacterium]